MGKFACWMELDSFMICKQLFVPMSCFSWGVLVALCDNRKPILTLPPIDSKIIMVEFTPAERQFYDALHEKSLTLFEGFIREGTASKSWLVSRHHWFPRESKESLFYPESLKTSFCYSGDLFFIAPFAANV